MVLIRIEGLIPMCNQPPVEVSKNVSAVGVKVNLDTEYVHFCDSIQGKISPCFNVVSQ